MDLELLVENLFQTLITGDRPRARSIVAAARAGGADARSMVRALFWPTYQMIDKLQRADQIGCLAHHMATRLLRVLVDQNAAELKNSGEDTRTIFAVCGPSETEELGAQMAVDLLESAGFSVVFGGSRVASDEILARVNEYQPDVLLLFSSAPGDLPQVRQLIDKIQEIGACPNLQVAVGGGVFNRAEGLAEEIGADIWAKSPMEIVDRLIEEPSRRAAATQRTVGRTRRRRAA